MNANTTVRNAHESNDPEIRRFQRNLATFRKLAGWTAEELGQKVGLTKQSIHNLECIPSKVRLSPGYYVAIRSAFENEADSRAEKDDIVLRQALNILLNQEETDESVKSEPENRAMLQTVADAQKRGLDKKYVWTMMLRLFPIISSAAFAVGTAWLEAYQAKSKR